MFYYYPGFQGSVVSHYGLNGVPSCQEWTLNPCDFVITSTLPTWNHQEISWHVWLYLSPFITSKSFASLTLFHLFHSSILHSFLLIFPFSIPPPLPLLPVLLISVDRTDASAISKQQANRPTSIIWLSVCGEQTTVRRKQSRRKAVLLVSYTTSTSVNLLVCLYVFTVTHLLFLHC